MKGFGQDFYFIWFFFFLKISLVIGVEQIWERQEQKQEELSSAFRNSDIVMAWIRVWLFCSTITGAWPEMANWTLDIMSKFWPTGKREVHEKDIPFSFKTIFQKLPSSLLIIIAKKAGEIYSLLLSGQVPGKNLGFCLEVGNSHERKIISANSYLKYILTICICLFLLKYLRGYNWISFF